jgi:HEAT repeat protein
VRQAAAESLGRLKAERAVEPLLPLLKDRDKDVRGTTAQALGHLGDARAIQALVETLADSQTEVRRLAAAALQKLNPDWASTEAARQAVPALKAAQQHHEYWVRQAATETLARIQALPVAAPEPASVTDTMHFRRKTAAEMLMELLGDYDRDLRLAAVEALGRLGDTRAITPLVASLRDDDVWVREAAIQSLNRLGWSPGDRLPA